MDKRILTEISVANVKELYSGSFIDDDLVLFDECADMPVPAEPRRIKSIIMGLCLHGSIEYTADTQLHTAQANDALIINEGQVVGNFSMSGDFSGIAMMLSYNMFQEIVQGVHDLSALFIFARTHPVFRLLPNESQSVVEYFNMIKDKVDDHFHHYRRDVARSLIATMIYDLNNALYRIQQAKDKKQTRAEAIFTRFIQLVEQNYKTERRVGWYGKQMCITPKYLSETVKQVSRRTPNDWIDYYVMVELRVQLKNTSKSIKEIATEMNFPNQSFLGKFFKEHAGMSPLAYRKS